MSEEGSGLPGGLLLEAEPAPPRRRRVALTAITLGLLWAVVVAAVVVAAVFVGTRLTRPSTTPTPTDDPALTALSDDGTTKGASEVEQGDCLLGWDPATLEADGTGDVVVVDCTSPHRAEAVGDVDLSDTYSEKAAYPGTAALAAAGQEACGSVFGGSKQGEAELTVAAIPPSETDWADGGRTVTCLAVSSTDLIAPLAR